MFRKLVTKDELYAAKKLADEADKTLMACYMAPDKKDPKKRVDAEILKCQSRKAFMLYVPTNYCMNLAATANVILYDRLAKEQPSRESDNA